MSIVSRIKGKIEQSNERKAEEARKDEEFLAVLAKAKKEIKELEER